MGFWNLISGGRPRRHGIAGGVRAASHKAESLRSALMPMPLPKRMIYPLQQHAGIWLKPVVSEGEHVLKGQRIADPVDNRGSPLHSSTSGIIVSLNDHDNVSSTGSSIVLTPDGEDRWTGLNPLSDYRQVSPDKVIDRIRSAGVIGLGGTAYSTAEKLARAKGRVHTLIINAAECEPCITADEALLRQEAAGVVEGGRILQYAIQAERCIIATQNTKIDATSALRRALDAIDGPSHNIYLMVFPEKYPTGGERQLVQGVTGKQVPGGKSPEDTGVLVQNTGTAYAVYRAVQSGEPLIERITTVTGATVRTPKNFQARLGTPIRFLLELCGTGFDRIEQVIHGGSLRGIVLSNLDTPVTPATNCLIAASKDEFPAPPPEQPCIRCGLCANVCPANLLPQQLHWFIRGGSLDAAASLGLSDCIECGACAHVCPSHIPLAGHFRDGKIDLEEQQESLERGRYWKQRFESRQARIASDAEERQRNRQSRLDKSPASVAKVTTDTDAVTVAGREISRAQARIEIAAAVARVKKRSASGATEPESSPEPGDEAEERSSGGQEHEP
ncbi:MAG: electron transport complex subunit RsxC [Pseudohongiellaceae bacterium]